VLTVILLGVALYLVVIVLPALLAGLGAGGSD